MPIDESHLGKWAPKPEGPFACIMMCNPGMGAELIKIDDDTVVMGNQTCCYGMVPQGGCPCPCCAWCALSTDAPCAFAPPFKRALPTATPHLASA